MKVIRYTLLNNGKVPSAMTDGGYFAVQTINGSPQDLDMIGISLGWKGLEEFTTKADFETYIRSHFTEIKIGIGTDADVQLQDQIDTVWNKSL